MSLFLSMSKDLGSRPIELTWLKVGDVDLTNGNVNLTGAKHTIGRNGRIKQNTLEMLKTYINDKKLKMNDRIFPTTSEQISNDYRDLRNGKTKDLLYVKQLLGHKDLRTTLRYTQLLNLQDNEEWICKATRSTEEASKLIEVGFQYALTTPDGTMLFKKRK